MLVGPQELKKVHRLCIIHLSNCNGVACFLYSKSSGSAAFTGMSWSCLLVRSVFSTPEKKEGPLWKKMVSEKVCASTGHTWAQKKLGYES